MKIQFIFKIEFRSSSYEYLQVECRNTQFYCLSSTSTVTTFRYFKNMNTKPFNGELFEFAWKENCLKMFNV